MDCKENMIKPGDLVRCKEGPCAYVDGGIGIVLQAVRTSQEVISVHVMWATDDLWYLHTDLEVVHESR